MRKGPLVSAVVVSNLLVRSLDLATVGRANAANLAQDLDRALDRGLTDLDRDLTRALESDLIRDHALALPLARDLALALTLALRPGSCEHS